MFFLQNVEKIIWLNIFKGILINLFSLLIVLCYFYSKESCVPLLPLDDDVSLSGRKLHHCYFVTLHVPCFFVILNIQDSIQHSLAVYINCGIFFEHMYIIVLLYRLLCKKYFVIEYEN